MRFYCTCTKYAQPVLIFLHSLVLVEVYYSFINFVLFQNCKLHNWRVLGTTGVSPSGGIDKYKGRTRSINEIETNGKCILVLGWCISFSNLMINV